MSTNSIEEYLEGEHPFSVDLPSGGALQVLTFDEVEYVKDRSSRYMSENRFSAVTDLQDIDRILFMELMVWRWSLWMSLERDYFGEPVDLDNLKKTIRDYSQEIRLVKKSVGLDKPSREKEKGESVPDYLANLRLRAKEFGVMREKQLTKSLILFNEFDHLYGLYQRCTPEERSEEGGIDLDGLFEWIEGTFLPEFREVDLYFQTHQQKFWIREV